MENYVTAQLAALCKAVLLGWLSGCVYDLLRSVRLLRRRSRALTHTLDALYGAALLLVLLGSWWGVRRRDRAAEQEAEAEHLLAGAGEPNALPRRWVTLFWSQRSSIAESRWAGMVESSLIIGSDAAQCDLCLPDRKVSPQHCVLAAQGDALLVQPLSDRAKVYVNGERIDGEHRLQNNDTLRIGKTTVRLVL